MSTVFSTTDALTQFSSPVLRSQLRRGLWQRPERGVVVTHNGPLSPQEKVLIALTVAAPRSALAGVTALVEDGFDPPFRTIIDVVLPEGARKPAVEDVRFHHSTELDHTDIHPARSPRRTRPARSTIDAASWAPTDLAARAVVLAAFQQGLVSVRTIREALQRRGRCRRRALVIESMLDASGGIQSLPERDFDRLLSAAGLPRPTRQRAIRGKDGRHYLDVDWQGWRVAAEVHGIPHMNVARWDADIVRANEVVIGGRRLLAFTSYAIRHDPDAVRDQLVRMFRASGWTNDDASEAAGGPNAPSIVPRERRSDAG